MEKNMKREFSKVMIFLVLALCYHCLFIVSEGLELGLAVELVFSSLFGMAWGAAYLNIFFIKNEVDDMLEMMKK